MDTIIFEQEHHHQQQQQRTKILPFVKANTLIEFLHNGVSATLEAAAGPEKSSARTGRCRRGRVFLQHYTLLM